MKKCILFDLDGTITDSGEGIIRCAIHMLAHFGLPAPAPEELRWIVGPPLRVSFPKLGVAPHQLEEAVDVYRQRYLPVGIYENTLYPGVEAMLQALQAAGHRLFIATSKPRQMAVTVLEHFGLAGYFELIWGAVSDKTRDSKASVIETLIQQIPEPENLIMVGDTAFDVDGATANGLATIGVSWGYGTVEEMKAAGAVAIADTMEQLFALLNE